MGALSSLTGGGGLSASGGAAGPSQSGDAKGGLTGGNFGISSPVVIGGFKTDGSATASNLPTLVLVGLGIAAALWLVLRRR